VIQFQRVHRKQMPVEFRPRLWERLLGGQAKWHPLPVALSSSPELLVGGSLLGIAGVSSDTNRRPRYPDVELHTAVTSNFFNGNLVRHSPAVSSIR
jgi:hypothetical protein